MALVFFGYTSCPDVCPTTLAEIRVLHEKLGADARMLRWCLSVSMRTTPQRLGEYIPLSTMPLSRPQPARGPGDCQGGYGAVAQKVLYNPQDSAAGYSIDHTARLYLIDKAGRLVTSYPYGSPVENIQKDVERVLK